MLKQTMCGLLATVVVCGVAAGGERARVIEKGGVRFYPKQRRIEVDGEFCLAEGPIELLASAKGGKEYESVIALDANPQMFELCLIMMKLRPARPGKAGHAVSVSVRWTQDGMERTVLARNLCWDTRRKRPLKDAAWRFHGLPRRIPPEDARNLVSTCELPGVIALQPGKATDSAALAVNKTLVPKPGTPCTLIVRPAAPGRAATFDSSRPQQ